MSYFSIEITFAFHFISDSPSNHPRQFETTVKSPNMAPPHHPLRRISTGSLSSLARSTDKNTSSPSGLEFLQPAMTDLADEAATLSANTSQMTTLHEALGTFNEAFAAYLYALKMNAFCVEWPEVSAFILKEY